MLSRLIFPACAAILFAGVFTSAVASPTDSRVTPASPSVSSDSNNSAVPNQSVIDSSPVVSPKLPAVDPYELAPNGIAAGSTYAIERDRLNSAIFAAPAGNAIAITGGANQRLPSMSRGDSVRSLNDNWRYRANPRDDLYGPLWQSRQQTVDRIGDMITPGFGRVEFDSGRNHIRIDYLYARKCRIKGAGVCFRMSF